MMMTKARLTMVMLGMLVAVLIGTPAFGGDVSSTEDKWGITVAPYLWMSSIKGDVTIQGMPGKVDATFGDILDELDFGGSLYLEARKGEWGIFLDTFYTKISADGEVEGAPAEVTVKNTFMDLGVTRQLYQGPWYSQGHQVYWDFRASGRYYNLDGELDIEGGPRETGSQDWIDPMIGLVFTAEASDNWTVKLRGDIGGFGIGSKFAWDFRFLLGYRLSNSADLWVGWEHREIDYSSGRGDDEFEYDLYYTGPILGASFRF